MSDVCPGWMANQTGSGVCCCGLHWEGTKPFHDERGRPLNEEKYAGKVQNALNLKLKRKQDKELCACPKPLPKGWRIKKVV